MATKKESPMMKQFKELKAKHPEAILLFRCGDFYETYGEDAVACAKVLGITLIEHKDGYKMAGFPHHALDGYLPKLIRAGKRVAICDQLEDPKLTKRLVKRGITELASNATKESETNISNNEETMAKEMKGADLIGKVLVLSDGKSNYVIKSVDGDKLSAEFSRGEGAAANVSLTVAQVESMISAGKAAWNGDTTIDTVEEVEEVSAITPTKPVATTVAMEPTTKPKAKNEKPKAKSEGRGKTSDISHQPSALKYETYTNKKGKTCAKISGFREGDAMLERENAESIHASASYERDKQGNKLYYLAFGPRYAEAAKEVCDALNAGKSHADCKAIIDRATEARAQQREEWKQRREERKANENANENEKPAGYSDKDVAEMLKKIMAGEAIPENIKAAMAA